MDKREITVPETEEGLAEWHRQFRPEGSGPLAMMRIICALIREVARLRGYQWPAENSRK